MIAKAVERKKGQGFKGLAAYVLDEKERGRGDPLDWQLADYILDRDHGGEKVAGCRITNCISDDPGWAVKECLALAASNTRSSKDKSYHLVVSFPPGERPTDEQMIDIENTLVAAIGFADHKRISAVHQDKKHWHLHVAIVTVHPVSHRNITPYYDMFKLQDTCVELEIKHNLARTNHGHEQGPHPYRAVDMEARGRSSFSRWVAENAAEPLLAAAAQAETWQDLHLEAAKYGVEIKPRGAGLIVANISDNRARIKASAVGPALSFKALTDRLGAYEAPGATVAEGTPTMRYDGRPAGASPDLWTRYQQERVAATQARDAALALLRARHVRHGQEMEVWHKQRYKNLAAQHLSFANRKSSTRSIDAFKADERGKRKATEKADRQKVRDQNKVPTWPSFLAREVGRGNEPAVKALDRFVTRQIERGEGLGR